jgi:hypothetical protein
LNFDLEPSSQRRYRYIGPGAPHAQFLRLVAAESDDAGAVQRQIFRLAPELTVRAGEEELVGDQSPERDDIGIQLRRAYLSLAANNLVISGTDDDLLHREHVWSNHGELGCSSTAQQWKMKKDLVSP